MIAAKKPAIPQIVKTDASDRTISASLSQICHPFF